MASTPLVPAIKGERRMPQILSKTQLVIIKLWGQTSRRIRFTGSLLLLLCSLVLLSRPSVNILPVPQVSLQFPHSPYNESKVALIIENRPNPILPPLILHFISVVPPDWRFRFMGSIESVELMNKSVAIREQVAAGKLDLTYIPSNMSTAGQEMISRFLTNKWLYETVLQPAEWLLVFQTDSMLCANTKRNINEFLEYDWIGAPWNVAGRWGGNGGLSMRRVSAMIDVLTYQDRVDGSEPEDLWLVERLAHRPGSKVANGTISAIFSGELNNGEGTTLVRGNESERLQAAANGELVEGIDDSRAGFYEPMGYHTGGTGSWLHGAVWGTPEMRKHIWEYCPEIKLTLQMDAAKFVPGDCNTHWKRNLEHGLGMEGDASSGPGDSGYMYGTEMIDGQEYPMLPPGFSAW